MGIADTHEDHRSGKNTPPDAARDDGPTADPGQCRPVSAETSEHSHGEDRDGARVTIRGKDNAAICRFEWNGQACRSPEGVVMCRIEDGCLLHPVNGLKYRWDGSCLLSPEGDPLFGLGTRGDAPFYRCVTIARPGCPPLYEWDYSVLRLYQGPMLYRADGPMPVAVPVLLAAGLV